MYILKSINPSERMKRGDVIIDEKNVIWICFQISRKPSSGDFNASRLVYIGSCLEKINIPKDSNIIIDSSIFYKSCRSSSLSLIEEWCKKQKYFLHVFTSERYLK